MKKIKYLFIVAILLAATGLLHLKDLRSISINPAVLNMNLTTFLVSIK